MSVHSLTLAGQTLAEPSTGASGALVVLGLILASLGLFYFMNRSLRRVPPTFEAPPEQSVAPGEAADEES